MGGNGGNSAYVLAGLGRPTALYSSVGRDTAAEQTEPRRKTVR
jgi:sugar/nucleoside kinase (ribokinase family)